MSLGPRVELNRIGGWGRKGRVVIVMGSMVRRFVFLCVFLVFARFVLLAFFGDVENRCPG